MVDGSPDRYEAIIIGSGQAGTPLALALAAAGRRTALVERDHVGGTCINEGCTPTKTMIASARIAHLVSRAGDYGISCSGATVDLERVRARKRGIVASFRAGSERRLAEAENLDLLRGEGRFVATDRIEVRDADGSTRLVEAPMVFLNVGTRPRRPDLAGIGRITPLDSTSIMELGDVPEHLIVLGGGYVGVEFAQMFRRFGARVTIVQRRDQLLPREDPDIAKLVADVLMEEGIEVELGAEAVEVAPHGVNGVELVIRNTGSERAICGSHLLMAAGRQPNTDSLNLEIAGVRTDERGYIIVNDRLKTNVPGIYALGDVKGGPAFTHISYDDYRVARANLLDGGSASIRDRLVPYAVFVDPQLGRIGLSEREARAAGIPHHVATMPMAYVARAIEVAESRGMIKAIVHAETDRILGAAVFGLEGGELMTVIQVAMMGDLPYTALRDGVFAHPTLAESLNNLFADLPK
ncbi:MAG: mercuric reductase [Candidatus Bipolaricaulia bacterium]